MAVRRSEFLESGGFDDDYFAYLEDVDFGWRQWIFGRRIVAEPRAVARHRGGATGEALGVFSRGFLFEKNAFATAYKNFDARALPEPDARGPGGLRRTASRRCSRRATRARRSSNAIRTPREAAPSFARRLFGVSEDVRGEGLGRRSPDRGPPPRALLDPPPPGALAAKRRTVQARPPPRGLRDLREVPAAPRADVSRRRALRLRFLRAVSSERAASSSRTTLEEIFEARGETWA